MPSTVSAPAFTLRAPLFDLKGTLESGQVFHWVELEQGRFRGSIDAQVYTIEQHGEMLQVTPGAAAENNAASKASLPETHAVHATHAARVARYFALDHPLEAIYASFPREMAMNEATAFCHGIRIIRQPAWECLATFITSSMKQVKHIQQMSHAIRQRYGTPIGAIGEGVALYPTAARLAGADETGLRECGLGFRAKSLLGAARAVAEGGADLEAIAHLPDAEALAALCRIPGVGEKIANCVLLFAYERIRAFPIDVWIDRALRHHYFAGKRKVTPQRLAAFAASHFGPYGGYAQQYLFHHSRRQPRSTWSTPKPTRSRKTGKTAITPGTKA